MFTHHSSSFAPWNANQYFQHGCIFIALQSAVPASPSPFRLYWRTIFIPDCISVQWLTMEGGILSIFMVYMKYILQLSVVFCKLYTFPCVSVIVKRTMSCIKHERYAISLVNGNWAYKSNTERTQKTHEHVCMCLYFFIPFENLAFIKKKARKNVCCKRMVQLLRLKWRRLVHQLAHGGGAWWSPGCWILSTTILFSVN